MSLLLDALKKAEQAKREKASAEAGGRPPDAGRETRASTPLDDSVELRLEPLPEEGAAGAEPPRTSASQVGQGPGGEPEESFAAGEGLGSSTLRLEMERSSAPGARIDTGELDLDEFARKLAESAPPSIDTGTLGAAELRGGSATAAHTMPSLKNVQAALKDFYGDATGAGPAAPPPPASRQPDLSGVETQTSQRAARNVFEAKERPVRKRRSAWAPLGITAVLLAVVLVGGYYATMSLITVQPSSLAASRPAPRQPALPPAAPPPTATAAAPTPSVPAPPAAPAPAAQVQAPVPPPAQAPVAQVQAPPPAQAVVLASPAPPAAPPVTRAPAPPAAVAAPPVTATAPPARPATAGGRVTEEDAYRLATASPVARPAAPAAAAPARAAEPPAARAAPSVAQALSPAPTERPAPRASAPMTRDVEPTARASGSSPVRIATRSEADPTYVKLRRAYEAFQVGSYEEARQLYREVLAREPRNRDALLGIGAVATALGESDQAQAVYRRVLIQNPQDRIATAAMTGLGGGGGAAPQNEARIKQALAQDPNAPYLNFALGNVYASQRRWSEAQQAYFDAYRSDGRNADYAFNLAVSLDRLGKRRQALEYYRRALELGERQTTAFSVAAVRERVERIEAAEGG